MKHLRKVSICKIMIVVRVFVILGQKPEFGIFGSNGEGYGSERKSDVM